MRNISFALTTAQFLDGSKTVTRRLGWKALKVGDVLCAVEKSQGLKKGDHVKVIGAIRVTGVRREPLRYLISTPEYGRIETVREGFPTMRPAEFIAMFLATHKGCTPDTEIARIEFERLPLVDSVIQWGVQA